MLRLVLGIFLILHGLVHLLYLGQSRRLFELQPGMTWPDDSWIVSKRLSVDALRGLASAWCGVAALLFALGGIGVLADGAWWHAVAVGAAGVSSALYVVFWDGTRRKLHDQGGIGILINVAVAVIALW